SESAFSLLYVGRSGANVQRLFTLGRKVSGLVEKACGYAWISSRTRKFKQRCSLVDQILFACHLVRSTLLPCPTQIRVSGIRSAYTCIFSRQRGNKGFRQTSNPAFGRPNPRAQTGGKPAKVGGLRAGRGPF